MRIKLPIFSIHGNHDYPTGKSVLSTLDIFALKEINYFGKIADASKCTVHPIIFQKGSTTVALYGLGFLKENKLVSALKSGSIKFKSPPENAFCMLVVHQNRRSKTTINDSNELNVNFLPEELIPDFIDLVVWGHEHESIPKVEKSFFSSVYIYQPGSTIVTSLIKSEAVDKHIGLLEIQGKEFKLTPIMLETVRPFVYAEVLK